MRLFKSYLAPVLLAAPLCAGLLASSTAANAAPHSAIQHNQNSDYRPRTDVLINNLNRLSTAIATARQNQTISPAEARSLRDELYRTRQAISRHSRNGLTQVEFQNLAERVNALRTRLRMERMDFDRQPR